MLLVTLERLRDNAWSSDSSLEVSWYINHTFPEISINRVSCVQADCDELDEILHNIVGLPICKSRVISWYGDMAKFIVRFLSENHKD